MNTPTAVKSTGKSYWVLGHRVAPLETIGDYAMLRIQTAPGVPGPPPHHHDDAAEFFLVLSGRLEVVADGEKHLITAGETFCIPPGVIHTFSNPGEEAADWITAFSPRGFEQFFTAFGVPVEEAGALQKSVSEDMIGRVIAGCGEYGMILSKG
ncbi:MAG: cupin domain-containing protein [Gemmatimonadetes bacterium]|nr:cupin domain-containing protein [Gemmatimonadota bacterium]